MKRLLSILLVALLTLVATPDALYAASKKKSSSKARTTAVTSKKKPSNKSSKSSKSSKSTKSSKSSKNSKNSKSSKYSKSKSRNSSRKSYQRSGSTVSAPVRPARPTMKWIDNEIPAPEVLCKAFFHNTERTELDKAFQKNGYAYNGKIWEKNKVVGIHYNAGNPESSLFFDIYPTDLYKNYLRAIKDFCDLHREYKVSVDDDGIWLLYNPNF